ncbi:MAG: FG-GAP repeat protein [Deltaproteobacteria bacterium]|nr:FG-GAP repeat protein [Deltaproteobacteria bacterium]
MSPKRLRPIIVAVGCAVWSCEEATREPACGDGVLDPWEECDDGNGATDDGCAADCRFSCHGPDDCDDGNACTVDECADVAAGRSCAHGPVAAESPCDDGNPCTTEDACNGVGTCRGPGPPPPVPGVPNPVRPATGEATGSALLPATMEPLRPVFRWIAPPDAGCGPTTYDLQVDDSCSTPGFAGCGFPSPEGSVVGWDGTTWRPSSPLPVDHGPVGRRYYWRVRACRAAGCSDWSRVRYADIGRAPKDFNGDGFSDLFASGATDRNASFPDRGAAYVYFGRATLGTTPDMVVGGEAGDEVFGGQVACPGDIDADTYADFIVGPGGDASGDPSAGVVYVFRGGASPDGGADLVLRGNEEIEWFGSPAVSAGDVNGDGFADFLVEWEDSYTLDPPWAEHVKLFFGGSVLDGNADVDVGYASSDIDLSAYAYVAPVGDVNGDGFDDLGVVHAEGDVGNDYYDQGWAYVYLGGPGFDGGSRMSAPGAAGEDKYGPYPYGVGDVNGDGFADYAFAMPTAQTATVYSNGGRIYLFFGGTTPPTGPDLVLEGDDGHRLLGWSVAGAGDVNRDGFADLAAIAHTRGSDSAGMLLVLLGSTSPRGGFDLELRESEYSSSYDRPVAGLGDLDADGYADLAIGDGLDVIYVCRGAAATDIRCGGLLRNDGAETDLGAGID